MQRTTLFLLMIALSLGGYVYLFELQSANQTVVNSSKSHIFSFKEKAVKHLKITNKEETLAFMRNDKGDVTWQMKQPEEVAADEAPIAFLLDLLITTSPRKTFEAKSKELQEYGLAEPFATIEIKLANNQKHKVLLGSKTFNEKGIYAQIDPDKTDSTKIDIVPMDFKNAVDRSLSDWKKDSDSSKEDKPDNDQSNQ